MTDILGYLEIHWLSLLIAFLCGTIATFFFELEDESQTNSWTKFKWFLNANEGWKRKWEWYGNEQIPITKKRWWYLWIWTPKYEPKFLYSSTLFVFLTDGEHLFQFFRNRFITFIGFAVGWQLFVAIQLGLWTQSLIKELIKWIK